MAKITEQNKEAVLDEVRNHASGKVKLAAVDIDGILRGKVMHIDKFLTSVDSGFGFCDVVFGWDSADSLYDSSKVTGWHSGYPDAKARIDLNTFRNVPWDNDLPFFLVDFNLPDSHAREICPRSLLSRLEKQAMDMGYFPVFSQEFEWFNFQETPHSIHEKNFQNPTTMTPGMFGYSVMRSSQRSAYFNDLFDMMGAFDVPLEGLHTETGPGVYEAAIRYSSIVEAGDRAALFKTGVKEIASRHDLIASFMAKWKENLPGCGGHVHQSLWDQEKDQNLFHDEHGERGMSDLMRSYLAGQLFCLPQILPLMAPTVNSYKRLVEGAWAPTSTTWGHDNRTTAIRVLAEGKNSCRMENRVVGSDVNPYLAMAACLASGLYGIRNNLKLEQAPIIGNAYADKTAAKLPQNLLEATQIMRDSDIAKELFGEVFVQHFTQSREWEWREFSKAVTNWELKRYFEIS